MRLGILSQWFDPEPGGAAIVGSLARQVVLEGHEARVLTGFPNYPEGKLYDGYKLSLRQREWHGAVGVRRVPLYPSHGDSVLGRLANYGSFALSATAASSYLSDVDALWVYNSPPSVSAPAWVIRKRMGVPTLLHVMDLWPDSLYASGFGAPFAPGSMLGRALEAAVRASYDSVDRVAYISPSVGSLLRERGVDAEKLVYIPLWADEALFYPREADEATARDLGLQGRLVVLYAGTIGRAQGLDAVLEVCRRLSGLDDVVFAFAGTGTAEPDLRALARRLRLKNVTFLGQLPKAAMPQVLALGDVHLVSLAASPLADASIPSKMQAIMAMGKPFVVAAGGDAASVVHQSGAGWASAAGDVDALEDAVRAALEAGKEGLAARGALARSYYESEFSLEVGVRRLLSVLL